MKPLDQPRTSRASRSRLRPRWPGALLCLCAAGLPQLLSGQDRLPTHRFGPAAGIVHIAIRDEAVSPLRYTASRMPWLAVYRYEGRTHQHAVDIQYTRYPLSPDPSRRQISVAAANLQAFRLLYAYRRRVASFKKINVKIFAGIAIENYYTFRQQEFLFTSLPVIEKFEEYFSAVDAQMAAQTAIAGKVQLRYTASAPMLAYLLRPAHSLKQGLRGGFTGWRSMKGIRQQVEIAVRLHKNLYWIQALEFSFLEISVPRRQKTAVDYFTAILAIAF